MNDEDGENDTKDKNDEDGENDTKDKNDENDENNENNENNDSSKNRNSGLTCHTGPKSTGMFLFLDWNQKKSGSKWKFTIGNCNLWVSCYISRVRC